MYFIFYFFFNSMCSNTPGLLRHTKVGKTSSDPKGMSSAQDLPALLSSPLSIFPLHPCLPSSLHLPLCPVFVLCVGQRSPVCGVHFQSPIRAGNPPGYAASLSQLMLFAGLFNTVKCLVKSSQIRRMTASPVTYTPISACLCVVFTDAFQEYRSRVCQA